MTPLFLVFLEFPGFQNQKIWDFFPGLKKSWISREIYFKASSNVLEILKPGIFRSPDVFPGKNDIPTPLVSQKSKNLF